MISALRISGIIRRSLVTEAVALDPNDTDQMDMRTLWNTDTDRARAELNWRITLVFTVFMMALMVVPLSVVNPRQGTRTVDAASHAAVSTFLPDPDLPEIERW